MKSYHNYIFVLFMDNVSFHLTDPIIEFLKEWEIGVIYNSPYTPQINHIEYIIKIFKSELRK